jgi:hypothetical protein
MTVLTATHPILRAFWGQRPFELFLAHCRVALRNATAAQAFVQQVSSPSSAEFHHYLTDAQWVSRFGPTLRRHPREVLITAGGGARPGAPTNVVAGVCHVPLAAALPIPLTT